MALPIISADERLAQRQGIKGCIFGRSGIGKTSLLWTLNASTTLFMDLEAGDLAVEGWDGDTLRPRTWKECRDFAVFIGGPNPALREDQPYSQAHFDEAAAGSAIRGPLTVTTRSSSTASPWRVASAFNGAGVSPKPFRTRPASRISGVPTVCMAAK